ncbi:C39 family peptidase [Oscillospiraceae bacterium OttesenSCG-928-F05]|nr:C39 family peptidase [Oscillospiraceae bacterium OttesenSCG-928-F05]
MEDSTGLREAGNKVKEAIRLIVALGELAVHAFTGNVYGVVVAVIKIIPTLIKILLWILALILIVVMIFMSMPTVMLGYESSTDVFIQEMNGKASDLEGNLLLMNTHKQNEISRITNSLIGDNGYDDIRINTSESNLNYYWFLAIYSVANQQDITAMSESDILGKIAQTFTYSSTTEDYTELDAEENEINLLRLVINITQMSAESFMDVLGFSEDEKMWARLIYATLAEDQNYLSDDPDYAGSYGTDYGDIILRSGGMEVVYFNQADSRWADESYGYSGTIGSSACGPTALSIAVSSLTDRIINPSEMSAWAYDNGYRAEGNGSYHSLIPEGARHFGLQAEGATASQKQKIVDALATGEKLVVVIMSKGTFATAAGHFIVLRGITEDGKVLVADPISVKRSNQEWDLSIILAEANRRAGAGGPFWIISR